MDLLSKTYEIFLLIPNRVSSAFTEYPFITKILDSCYVHKIDAELPDITINFIKEEFTNNECYYAYHNEKDIAFLSGNPQLSFINQYPVLDDSKINIHIGRTRKYLQKLQLISATQLDSFDCIPRTPVFTSGIIKNDIIIYQGSRDILRKLPSCTIEKFISVLPDALYLVTQKTIDDLNLNNRGIRTICIDPFIQENLINIIKVFQSSPKVLIGPDSGLTHVATCYRVPLIWLESRTRIEAVIDNQYKNMCKIYSRPETQCKQDCFARVIMRNHSSYWFNTLTFNANQTPWNQLECRKEPLPSCLDYTEKEIVEIVNLIK